ncbi:MAG: C39 family peptidase [Anaerolineaceae bacterium]|nr:C39 family peptidase [Anaerolineaceae bacterium]
MFLVLAGLVLIVLVAGLVFLSSTSLQMRARLAMDYLRGVVNPIGTLAPAEGVDLPTSNGVFAPFTSTATTGGKSRAGSAAPLPVQASLTSPEFVEPRDLQGWNNCGPATLALALRMYGWKGDQQTVAAVIKPKDLDKNVNVEELASYAQSAAGLAAAVRVGGTLDVLQRLIAAGYPVIIERDFTLEKSFWPGDDRWSSHFVLLTGYDQSAGTLTTQDAYYGPDVEVDAEQLVRSWKAFNYVYMVLYPSADAGKVAALLGDEWSEEKAYQTAVTTALQQTQADRTDLYAWFNLGSSYVGLGQYESAWLAFNEARKIGLPQRMLRYQFGPFEAAYATGRAQDLQELVNYAMKTTPNSEEALFWQGKLYLMQKQPAFARKSFLEALSARPGYAQAQSALNSLQ